jgi:two-component system, sensor histidine kinase and response regulator
VSFASSSLVLKKIVHHQVWLQLVELWLAMVTKEENLLITEDTLLKLANSEKKINLNQQPETSGFFLLITAKFKAFLRREQTSVPQKYLITVTFDQARIINELTQLGYQNQWEITVIKYLQAKLIPKLTQKHDYSEEFMVKLVKLLINDPESSKNQYNSHFNLHNSHFNPPMDKLLHYQVEQERIFDRLKIQISQNLNLSEIIQTAINYSCSFLALDRILIYQFDVPLESEISSNQEARTIDIVTYEAKKNDNIISTLYSQEEICWQQLSHCKNKYRQGFGLVVNDIEVGSNFHPCLQSLMLKLQVRAKAVTPINVRGKLWGLMIAHQCFEPRQWHYQDIQFLRQIGEYLAIAIHHHESYQQLQQQKKLLEKQVQVQAQQIKDALIAAEAASKSKHEFLGSMSHELRTPLTCVIGLSSTLLQWSSTKARASLSPEKQQEYLHLIQQSGKHLLVLINNILEFSEVESGKHLLNIKQILLTEIAKQSIQITQDLAKAKQITLNLESKLAPEQNYFLADEARLKEIIFNLLSNGIKFTPEQGQVTLRVWREKHQVVFQVEDTGIGIAETEMPLLFEKFKQLENFRERTHGGTGLGLALTKKLVELHGGTIEVESALGEGAMFTVYLPETTPIKPYFEARATIEPQLSSVTKTIMLITEDEESATFICQLLNTIDCQAVWLMDMNMAISQIEILQPSVIIFDHACTKAGVKKVAKEIADKSLRENTNLVLLCDRLNNSQWQRYSKYGINDYLLKSMNPTQMINKISNLIQGKENYHEKIRDEG